MRGTAPPRHTGGTKVDSWFPFRLLDVGDSFLVDHCTPGTVNSSCIQYRKRHAGLFHIRSRNDEKEGWRIQCWRLE